MIAYLTFGGSGYWSPQLNADGTEKPLGVHAPGMNRTVMVHGGLSESAKVYGPKLQAKGISRVHAQHIGGHWPLWPYDDSRERTLRQNLDLAIAMGISPVFMHRNQWLLAEQARCPWADRRELALFHNLLVADYGVKEVIYYLGGVSSINGLPPDVRLTISKLSLEPFIRLKGASFGFDHDISPEHFEQDAEFFRWLKRENPTAKIYTEGDPELAVDYKQYAKLTDGAIASLHSRQEIPGQVGSGWGKPLLDNYIKNWKGETITLVQKQAECPAGQTPLVREW